MWAVASKIMHSSFRPYRAPHNGWHAFSSYFLVDDQVLVDVLMGNRPWENARCSVFCNRTVFVPESINEVKGEEEAAWAKEKMIWGIN